MFLKTYKLFFFIFTFSLFPKILIFCEPYYVKMVINPLNRLTIFFDELPKDITTSLNSEKTIISIIVYDASSKINVDSCVSDGIIRKAEIKKFSNHLEINIYLKSPRGYTISPLEFSRALMVEIFDWKSLNPAEDNYRMGQLALLDNLTVARKYFELAFNDNIANAGFFLGYLYLKANFPEKANQILTKAENLGCNIPDIFAALAQTNYLLDDKINYERYKAKFLSEQRNTNFKFIEIAPQLKDSIFKELTETFEERVAESPAETNKKIDTPQISKPIIISENKSQEDAERYSILEKILIFLIVSIILVTILLVSLYFKWKKEKKLLAIKKKFENELIRQRQRTIPTQIAAQTYKKTEEITKSKPEDSSKVKEQILNPEIKILAEQIIDSKKNEMQKENIEKEKTKPKKTNYPPRVEMAIQIQKEQAELIKRKIENLEPSEIPTDTDKLFELAKNLGITKTSLLAKKNIEALEKNKELFKNLYQKFFHKEND